MWFYVILLTLLNSYICIENETDEVILYYYGLEESERSLPFCEPRQACSALIPRYWRASALVRLCRCARRLRCDSPAKHNRRIAINNRAYLQFCQPVTSWPQCSNNAKALTVMTTHERMNPDELEELHHRNIHLEPPKIIFSCRCPEPNYWKLHSNYDNEYIFQCSSLPLCMTDEQCGHVNLNLYTLYQSCLCPKGHICIHEGGIAYTQITELLYIGKGWKAHCTQIANDSSYEDY
ncbi:uncharacterized protein LOC114253516 [Bombyx mandarina]|uniref:Uncharacterized protein LOC114253516 n=1 Tax=Bombyx mandarina TaxID=7092 RepID=A0A6J2KPH2_BOMMA|nr:uncharacterized protein LOC114253516 [Bombyx mandarina]